MSKVTTTRNQWRWDLNECTNWSQPDSEGHLVTQLQENKRGHLVVFRSDLYSLAGLGPWGAKAWGRATPRIPWPTLGPSACCRLQGPCVAPRGPGSGCQFTLFPTNKIPLPPVFFFSSFLLVFGLSVLFFIFLAGADLTSVFHQALDQRLKQKPFSAAWGGARGSRGLTEAHLAATAPTPPPPCHPTQPGQIKGSAGPKLPPGPHRQGGWDRKQGKEGTFQKS